MISSKILTDEEIIKIFKDNNLEAGRDENNLMEFCMTGMTCSYKATHPEQDFSEKAIARLMEWIEEERNLLTKDGI